jgi:hypothetical protein
VVWPLPLFPCVVASDRPLDCSPLQRAVADAVLENIEAAMRAGAKPSLEHLCRLLLTADQHDVTGLRDACLAAIAHQFDALAAGALGCAHPVAECCEYHSDV